jgi:hypothetical protein
MARWITKDVAKFEHNDDPNKTIIGKIECLVCTWTREPTSQFIFPTVDDAVEDHVSNSHPDVINAAGIQRTPADGTLVYYVILNP